MKPKPKNGRSGKRASDSRRAYKGVCVRRDLRLAVYLRDGLACCWCGHGIEDGAQLSLDHCTPASKGGSNDPGNLVTCCQRCNKSRQDRGLKAFAEAVAHYLNDGIKPDDILAHLRRCRARSIERHRKEAKEMIARRGTMAAIFKEMT